MIQQHQQHQPISPVFTTAGAENPDPEKKINQIRTLARPLAYTSEVGEAFRPIIPRAIVNTAYAISIGYVLADTAFHTRSVYKKLYNDMKYQHLNNDERSKQLAINCVDKTVWHTFASMVLPALTVHTVVKFSGKSYSYGASKFIPHVINAAKYARVGSVGTGLLIIPFIIHPLDHLTDYVMDNTLLRKWYHDYLISIH